MADVSAEALNRVAEAQGVKRRYEKPEDLIADREIDIVDICTPNRYHAPLAVAALEAGKHVICEKPLGRDAALGGDRPDRQRGRGHHLTGDRTHRRPTQPLQQLNEDANAPTSCVAFSTSS